MNWMIQFQVLGEDTPRTILLQSESREDAVDTVFKDFFSDNPGSKLKLLSAMEVIDTRSGGPGAPSEAGSK